MSGDHLFLASLIGALLSLGIGAWYFVRSANAAPMTLRLLTSAYAPFTAILYAVAFIIPRESWATWGRASLLVAQVVPAALLLASLVAYPGAKRLHLLLVPFALLFWACQFVVAQIAVFGM